MLVFRLTSSLIYQRWISCRILRFVLVNYREITCVSDDLGEGFKLL